MRFIVSLFMLISALTYGQSERTILYAQATDYGYRNQFKEAEKILSQVIALFPNDSLAYFDRAIMRENLGDTLGAIADLTKEIEVDPKSADNYFLRGMLYHKTKMYNEALADFKKVNQLDAGNADSHYFAAQLFLVLEQNKYLAKRQLKKCLRINSAHEEAMKLVLQIS
jgi:tetratricopeptide (TPR) repeat protein